MWMKGNVRTDKCHLKDLEEDEWEKIWFELPVVNQMDIDRRI